MRFTLSIGERLVLAGSVGLLTVLATVGGASAAKTPSNVIYNSTIIPLPGGQPSNSAEAFATNELGNQVTLAGASLVLGKVTVTMVSWACRAPS